MSHQHEWTPTDTGHACTECEATTDPCNVCRGPIDTPALACHTCLDYQRRTLDQIEEARDRIRPDPPAPVRSYTYDLANITGDNTTNLPFDLDRFVDDWALGVPGIKTAAGVDDLLLEWVSRWTEYAGAENLSPADYLRSRLMWAANNPDKAAWDDYRAEMRDLLGHARSLSSDRTDTGESCIDCGGHIIRKWRDDGLGDDAECANCGGTYDHARFRLAVRDRHERAATIAPDTLVTDVEATRMLGLGTGTVRKWVERGQLVRAGTRPARYRLGDVRAVRDNTTSERINA
ncbi:MAG TPA: hypothetical protein VIO38_16755 [Rariglobus sp.]